MILEHALVVCLSLPTLPHVPALYIDPELTALSRFPPLEVAVEELRFAREVKGNLEARSHLNENDMELGWQLAYVFHCVDVWEDLIYALSTNSSTSTRVDWLDSLRAKLGEKSFARGEMPNVIWCFARR